jgi:type II secretory pathway component PulF
VPAFAYRAIDPQGKRLTGSADAPTGQALARSLEDRGLVVTEINEEAFGSQSVALGGPSTRDLVEVTRALAALLPAGLPLAKALDASRTLTRGALSQTLDLVRQRVERGDALATALADHPAVFPPMYVGLVRAGEKSGDLDGAFTRLAAQLERDEELRSKLISAAIYPSLLALVGGAAVLVLLLLVIPRFGDLLQGSGAQMPRTTAIVLALSGALREHWPWLFVLAGAVAAFGVWAANSAQGARAAATSALSLPLIGRMRRELLAARFARLTAVLLAGGAPLLGALDDVTDSLGDPVARDDVARIRGRVREGASLNRAIAEGSLFPTLLAELVSVGEQSGRLQDFLAKAADVFERRTERATARVVALAEPAMIVAFGGVVGFVALALLQAIYGVNAGSLR